MAEFVYDALGRRIYAYDAIAGAGRYFCYNNGWQVLEEYNTAGSFAWANVFGNYIDEVLVRSATSSKYYYAHNHLYSPVAVMDFTAGTVLERYDYDAYGATHIMDASYTARTASAVGNPYSFTGRELDTLDGGNLKTMHYRHRSYDPLMGRFGQQDPLGISPQRPATQIRPQRQYRDSNNSYEYVKSMPLKYLDPSGFLPVEYPSSLFPPSEQTCKCQNNSLIDRAIESIIKENDPHTKEMEQQEKEWAESHGLSNFSGFYRHCVSTCHVRRATLIPGGLIGSQLTRIFHRPF